MGREEEPLKIFTDRQVEDMNRRWRLLQNDVAELKKEKAELARRLRECQERGDKAQETAAVYVDLALGAVADLSGEDRE